jgi:hypothetical protein
MEQTEDYQNQWKQYLSKVSPYTGVGKSRFTVVHMEKDMQVTIITIALLIIIIIIIIIILIIRREIRQIIQINNK